MLDDMRARSTLASIDFSRSEKLDGAEDECTSMTMHIIDCIYTLQAMLLANQSSNNCSSGDSSNNASSALCKSFVSDLVKFVVTVVTDSKSNNNNSYRNSNNSNSDNNNNNNNNNNNYGNINISNNNNEDQKEEHPPSDDYFKVSKHVMKLFPHIYANNMQPSHLLHLCCTYSHGITAIRSIEMILSLDPKQASYADSNGRLALHCAAMNKNLSLDAIKLLTEANKNAVSTPDFAGLLPLHLAVVESLEQRKQRQDTSLLGYNVMGPEYSIGQDSNGNNSNRRYYDNNNYSDNNHLASVIDYLIEIFPASTNHACKKGRLPLHMAISNDKLNYNIISSLVTVNPNSLHMSCKKGWLPLHRLLAKSDVDISLVKLLIWGKSQQAQLSSNFEFGKLLQIPMRPVTITSLKKHNKNIPSCKINLNNQLPIHIYCDVPNPKIEIVTTLIESYPESLLVPDKNHYLPIHIAADKKCPNYDLIWALLLQGGRKQALVSAQASLPYPNNDGDGIRSITAGVAVASGNNSRSDNNVSGGSNNDVSSSSNNSSSNSSSNNDNNDSSGYNNNNNNNNNNSSISSVDLELSTTITTTKTASPTRTTTLPPAISTPSKFKEATKKVVRINSLVVSSSPPKTKVSETFTHANANPAPATSSAPNSPLPLVSCSPSSLSKKEKSQIKEEVAPSIGAINRRLYLLHFLVGIPEKPDIELCKVVAALYPEAIRCSHQCEDCSDAFFYDTLNAQAVLSFLLDRFYDIKYPDTDLLQHIKVTAIVKDVPLPKSTLNDFKNALIKAIYEAFKDEEVFFTKSNIHLLTSAQICEKKELLKPVLVEKLQMLIDRKLGLLNQCICRKDPLVFMPYRKALERNNIMLVKELDLILVNPEYRRSIIDNAFDVFGERK